MSTEFERQVRRLKLVFNLSNPAHVEALAHIEQACGRPSGRRSRLTDYIVSAVLRAQASDRAPSSAAPRKLRDAAVAGVETPSAVTSNEVTPLSDIASRVASINSF